MTAGDGWHTRYTASHAHNLCIQINVCTLLLSVCLLSSQVYRRRRPAAAATVADL